MFELVTVLRLIFLTCITTSLLGGKQESDKEQQKKQNQTNEQPVDKAKKEKTKKE